MSICDTCSSNDGTCTEDSSTCGLSEKTDFSKPLNKASRVKKVIGVVSGKGGVGKSLVTSLLAIYTNRLGYKTAILDADITGPSIPKVFGLTNDMYAVEEGILPGESKKGVKIMSLNLLLKEDTDPVVWRGPVIANTVTQFWTDTVWGDIDYMFIDMPPGTGDVPLTVFQSLPVDGVIIVSSPQDLVSMIVSKSIKMANMMDIPVLGIVENMSYAICPDCKEKINIFGESKIEEISKEHDIKHYDRIPINPEISRLSDLGSLEDLDQEYLENILEVLR